MDQRNSFFTYTLKVPWGQTSFIFEEHGTLIEIKLNSLLSIGEKGKKSKKIPPLKVIRKWIFAYLNGDQKEFPGEWLMPGTTKFQKNVYLATLSIPPGEVSTYGEIAIKAGSPKATRAVGSCMAKNPLPLIIPCHRIVSAGGGLGGVNMLPTHIRFLPRLIVVLYNRSR